PGPVAKAFASGKENARKAALQSSRTVFERALTYALLGGAALYLALNVSSAWRLMFAYVAGAFGSRALISLLRALRPQAAETGPFALLQSAIGFLWPWLLLGFLGFVYTLQPFVAGEPLRLPLVAIVLLALLTLFFQSSRLTAVR